MRRTFPRWLRALVFATLWLGLHGAWAATAGDERILGFHSDIRIEADGSMQVTETIRVSAEGINIRRGIYREFPTRYRDEFGNNYIVDFTVLDLTRTAGRSRGMPSGAVMVCGWISVTTTCCRCRLYTNIDCVIAPRASSAISPTTMSFIGMSPESVGVSRSTRRAQR